MRLFTAAMFNVKHLRVQSKVYGSEGRRASKSWRPEKTTKRVSGRVLAGSSNKTAVEGNGPIQNPKSQDL